jgi:multimeric flavodoxin WrbA
MTTRGEVGMKTYVLHDGVDRETGVIKEELEELLSARGHTVSGINIRESGLKRCMVCDYCGTKEPGVCVRKDDGNNLARGMARSELFVVITSISFGGYSASGKLGIERTIPNVSPFFLMQRGELHHRLRYQPTPNLLMIGWHPQDDPAEAGLFERLAERNATNFLSAQYAAKVFSGTPVPAAIREDLDSALNEMETGKWYNSPDVDYDADSALAGSALSPWLVISCSGRRKSNTRSISEYLTKALEKHDVRSTRIDLAGAGLIDNDKGPLLDAIRKSAGVLVVSPLYHDTLSYAAVQMFEYLAAHRAGLPRAVPFVGMIHSGYPEPVHCRNGLGILKAFCRKMGWDWKGGFSAGTTSPIGGESLEEVGFLAKRLRVGLDGVAEALAGKRQLPDSVKPPMSPRLLQFLGNAMLRREMKTKGIDHNARPFAAT